MVANLEPAPEPAVVHLGPVVPEAVIDLVIPDAAGQTNMGQIQLGIDGCPPRWAR